MNSFLFTLATVAILQARREPQRGQGKHSREGLLGRKF